MKKREACQEHAAGPTGDGRSLVEEPASRGGSFCNEEAIALLVTGRRRSGEVPRPPMPVYGMTREDAAAVVAYLESLPPPR